jgi:short-subunit dehydrogenase
MHAKAGAENSLYVRLLPVMSADKMAHIAYRRFKRGRKRIVAGWFNRLTTFGARFVPDSLLLPVMDLLFRVRDAEGNVQWPRPPARP